jgi:hypothetical protein
MMQTGARSKGREKRKPAPTGVNRSHGKAQHWQSSFRWRLSAGRMPLARNQRHDSSRTMRGPERCHEACQPIFGPGQQQCRERNVRVDSLWHDALLKLGRELLASILPRPTPTDTRRPQNFHGNAYRRLATLNVSVTMKWINTFPSSIYPCGRLRPASLLANE